LVVVLLSATNVCVFSKSSHSSSKTNSSEIESIPASSVSVRVGPPDATPGENQQITIKPLTKEEEDALLSRRLSGGISGNFDQFSKMFFVSSKLNLSTLVALVSSSPKVSSTMLKPQYPLFYKPTLREFLDTIAQETSTRWSLDNSGKYFHAKEKLSKPLSGISAFEFTEIPAQKNFELTLPSGWTEKDKGIWISYKPPTFPIGLDVYDMGTYSPEDPAKEAEFIKSVPENVGIEWAQKVKSEATKADFKPAKVGEYEALLFDSEVPGQNGKKLHWKQWTFMVGNRCFMIVSAIYPEFEARISTEVQGILKTFRVPQT